MKVHCYTSQVQLLNHTNNLKKKKHLNTVSNCPIFIHLSIYINESVLLTFSFGLSLHSDKKKTEQMQQE